MESQEKQLNAQVIERAWEDAQFKKELLEQPVETMEKLTGRKINLPNGQKLVVVDQMDESVVYFNIPRKIDINSLELTEEQLEQVAGGVTPAALLYGIGLGIAIWAATHQG
ncbi:class IIb bacteriocin, lactobin A/cerein 7B family [Chryseobacterium sp. Leaf201]|uniref:class IIb bacteriocin, lactobin A/cerein 7B family n=1 Tax=Chryseobacterium sp. Leaf201 TaxID=1735672 RepID=UPI0007014C74|nr:class IIb bacteriocin, lactobin A/cerein 7B family [Chryseobacterium sp. Leaf201]KQM19129.1 TOMM propeptide domain-containing protein [Chryseobacterium sp. Leaf201]